MELTILTKQQQLKIRSIIITTVGLTVATFLFGYVLSAFQQAPYDSQFMFLALSSGAISGFLISVLEFWYVQSDAGRWIRQAPFIKALVCRTVIASVLIFIGLVIANLIFAPGRFLGGGMILVLRDVSFLFIVFVVFYFIIQVRRIVGGRVLRNFILGRYHRPVQEDRIFMFLDLVGSTSLSQELGDIGVHSMIKQFFFDIAEPILEHDGETHRYVGDQVVVTWPFGTRQENRRCLDCYFAICAKIEADAASYKEKFGSVPGCRVGLHGGSVVAGECGDDKQEIVYYGDTVNTAARLEQACKTQEKHMLISVDLLKQIDMPEIYRVEYLGAADLRGRSEGLEIATVEKIVQ